jgi:hypothetical protein
LFDDIAAYITCCSGDEIHGVAPFLSAAFLLRQFRLQLVDASNKAPAGNTLLLNAAVDSPELDGPIIQELADLSTPLIHYPRALGLKLTFYDPGLDPDRSCANRLFRCWRMLLSEVAHLTGGWYDRSNMARDGSRFQG